MEYTLTAAHPVHGKRTIRTVCDNDSDATMWGISRMLDLAMDHPLWAEGAIVLKQGKRVVHSAPAK